MPRRVDLLGCQAKLDHAKQHIDMLRQQIEEAGAPDATLIPLSRTYDPAAGAVIYRITRVICIPDHWPMLVGDAVHDLRCALDHLMWQLAVVHLGRQPTARQARDIQFPEVRKLADFNGNRFLTHIRPSDIERLKPFQPYRRLKKGELHPLPKLIRLSNTDKHRKPHMPVVIPQNAKFTNRSDALRDCVPYPTAPGPGGRPAAIIHHVAPSRNPHAGDEILRIFVRPTGPNPDVELDATLHGYVGIGRLGPAIPMLDAMAQYVGSVLNAFRA